MRVLVTGAGGYLGNILIPMLRSYGDEIIGIDLDLFHTPPKDCEYIIDDLATMSITPIMKTVDAVVHLAGVSNDPACELDPKLSEAMNLDASYNLIRAAERARVNKFVYASSASVYGKVEGTVTEDGPFNPQSLYAMHKLAVEDLLNDSFCINPIILRFGTLFGPSDKMRFDIAINLMMKNALTDKVITVNGGKQNRPFLHIVDAARAIIHGLGYYKSTSCNIASMNMNIDDLAQAIANFTDAEIINNDQAQDTRDYKISTERMINDFNFIPQYSLNMGLGDLQLWISSALQDGISLNQDKFYTIKCWKEYIKHGYSVQ